jgi:hypothetical protein
MVIAHGMVGESVQARVVAKYYVDKFKKYSEAYGVVIVVPIFDKKNYGSQIGPLGGYRGLIGRKYGADEFLNQIIDSYVDILKDYDGKFVLIGHSAGGQFVSRYIAKHPERIIHASIIAAGSYMYLDKEVEYPFGLKRCYGYIRWNDGEKKIVDISLEEESLRKMVSLSIRVVVGEKDVYEYEETEGQMGVTRISRGMGWVNSVRGYAKSIGENSNIEFVLVKGAGHGSPELFSAAVRGCFNK